MSKFLSKLLIMLKALLWYIVELLFTDGISFHWSQDFMKSHFLYLFGGSFALRWASRFYVSFSSGQNLKKDSRLEREITFSGGKITLTKLALCSMPIHIVSVVHPPDKIIKEIHQFLLIFF